MTSGNPMAAMRGDEKRILKAVQAVTTVPSWPVRMGGIVAYADIGFTLTARICEVGGDSQTYGL